MLRDFADTPKRAQPHLLNEGATASASTVDQQSSVKSKLVTQFPSFTGQRLQYHTPIRDLTDSGLGTQQTPPPTMLSPQTDLGVAPAHAPPLPPYGGQMQVPSHLSEIRPRSVPANQTSQSNHSPLTTAPPVFRPDVQITMPPAFSPQASVHGPTATPAPHVASYPNYPAVHSTQHPTLNQSLNTPYPTMTVPFSPQAYTSHLYSTPAPQAAMPSPLTVQGVGIMNNPSAAEQTLESSKHGLTPRLPHMPLAAVHDSRAPLHSSAISPNTVMPPIVNMTHGGFIAPPGTHASMHVPTSALDPQVSGHPGIPPQQVHTSLSAPGGAAANANPPLAAYGGFIQTHQVKNVQVFTGSADSKVLVEDWIRDMQYLLEAIELPIHLRFSTVVRHLTGEARKLVLNLPLHDQTPERAFEELRAEYGDTQSSSDLLADFYERVQRSGESACSYAIALEATLRAVEENQRGGKPFPDRDSKLTRQFIRGINDEDVYARISPMKPRLLSFRELQAELRNLAKETKRFQPQNKSKKTYAQVQVASECSVNVKAEKAKHSSEWSELAEMVKKLALSQEEQMAKLTHLESRIYAPSSATPLRVRPPPGATTPMSVVTCYRCGKQGHIARVCRAVLPGPEQTWAHDPQPVTPMEGNTYSAQPLNR